MCTGPYESPTSRSTPYSVYTNNLPNGAFRGFGGPQAAFAAEGPDGPPGRGAGHGSGGDSVVRNLLREGALLSVGTPLPGGRHDRQGRGSLCHGAPAGRRAAGGWKRPPASDAGLRRRSRISSAGSASPAASRTSASPSARRSSARRRSSCTGRSADRTGRALPRRSRCRPGRPHGHAPDGRRRRRRPGGATCSWWRRTPRTPPTRAPPPPRA